MLELRGFGKAGQRWLVQLTLRQAGGYFGIARNLPAKFEKESNSEKYQPVLEVLNGLQKVTPDNVGRVVEDA